MISFCNNNHTTVIGMEYDGLKVDKEGLSTKVVWEYYYNNTGFVSFRFVSFHITITITIANNFLSVIVKMARSL